MQTSTSSTERTQLTQADKVARTRHNQDELKERFLSMFSEICNMTNAAEAIGINRTTVYNWKRSDPDFAERFDQARIDGAEVLEDVAIERAQDTSDRLIAFLLKSYRPERFGDRVDITSGGKPIDLSWPEAKAEEVKAE